MIGSRCEVLPLPQARLPGFSELARSDQGRRLPTLPPPLCGCCSWLPAGSVGRQHQGHALFLLRPLFERGMRPDLFRPLGHGHPPVFAANRADPGTGAGGRGRPIHPWRLVLRAALHFDQLRLPVGGQMAQAHRPYPLGALPDGPAAGQSRCTSRPVHTQSPLRSVSECTLCHRRIPTRTSNGHHGVIRAFNARPPFTPAFPVP